MRNYKNIIAWQLADDFTIKIYEVTKNFPKEEMFAMVSQLRRAAYSAPSNIAEGSGRRTDADFRHFLDMAMGSLTEVEYFLHLARRLNYLSDDIYENVNLMCSEVIKCLRGFMKSFDTKS